MDVLVTPAPGPNAVWNLTDRLGRDVGRITYAPEQGFVIVCASPGENGLRSRIESVQPTLDAAMDAIALRLKGACQLASTGDQ